VNANTTDPMIGRLLDGRYQVRSRIARGGMATVYLATDLRLERRVAIKIMHGHLADDSKFKERFIQEARSAARLAHPNVVNVFDQGQDSDMAYLVMEYLPGITLRDLLQEHPVLTTGQTLDILEAVLAGLAAAHKAGIVHRDLKPENVLLADDGRIKIGDFGLARAASANTATGAALLGTIAYLSPELVTRGIADTRSDIYAVGIMMFEMLAGEQPFKGEQPMQIAYQHANDSVPAPSSRNPRVPAELDELVLWATARDPEERPKDARALLDRLFETHSSLMTALPTGATPTQRTMVLPGARASSSTAETAVIGSRVALAPATPVSDSTAALTTVAAQRRRRGWWIAGIIALVVAIAATTGWYFGAGPGSRVTIPDSLAGLSEADARVALADLGLVVLEATGQIDSPTVVAGLVADSAPGIGESVTRGTEVQLLISTGPRPIPVPAFAGMTEADATQAITDAPFTLAEPVIRQFSGDVAAGLVIDALDVAGVSLTGVATYGELQAVTLIISSGPLPDVGGKSIEEATQILAGVKLTATAGQQAFSDFPEGTVVGIDPEPNADGAGRVFREGDSVFLVISRGPDLVAVPDVIGDNIADAKAELEAAGFVVEVTSLIPEESWDNPLAVVASTNPGPGEQIKRGSTVTIIGEL
jgi:beta-lactam-binding protein with PASTA domain/tRNA A-37 threonylcarbamoyl transferase component Bud32